MFKINIMRTIDREPHFIEICEAEPLYVSDILLVWPGAPEKIDWLADGMMELPSSVVVLLLDDEEFKSLDDEECLALFPAAGCGWATLVGLLEVLGSPKVGYCWIVTVFPLLSVVVMCETTTEVGLPPEVMTVVW